jgi:hypothetical protein
MQHAAAEVAAEVGSEPMKSLVRVSPLLIAALMVACASVPPTPDELFAAAWSKANAGDADLGVVKTACFSKATAAAIGERETDRFRYISCMEREGWTYETPSQISFTEDWKPEDRSQARFATDDTDCRQLASAMFDARDSRAPKRADRNWIHVHYLSCMNLKGWKQ